MKVNIDNFADFRRTAGNRVPMRVKSVENDERGNTAEFTLEDHNGDVVTNKFDFDNEGARRAYFMFSKNLNKGEKAIDETTKLVGMSALFDLVEAEKRGVSKNGEEIIYINVGHSYPEEVPFEQGTVEPTADELPKTAPF